MSQDDLSDAPRLNRAVRQMILSHPQMVLADDDIMTALGHELTHRGETADIRARTLDKMSAEIDRLTQKNDQIMAAAYQSAAVVQQVHRAVSRLATAQNRAEFVTECETTLCGILRIPHAKIEQRYVRVLTMNGHTAELPLDDANVLVLTGEKPDTYAQSQGQDLLRFFHDILKRIWATCPEA
ncbi:MAG: DUF484 family protein [Pseudomonadota bacterium]